MRDISLQAAGTAAIPAFEEEWHGIKGAARHTATCEGAGQGDGANDPATAATCCETGQNRRHMSGRLNVSSKSRAESEFRAALLELQRGEAAAAIAHLQTALEHCPPDQGAAVGKITQMMEAAKALAHQKEGKS
eukprot:TRINITY_DN1797_c0_g1_i2.p2 TRINITY_DN1797_c0_g1~~TRINITY_DN1797_c0_g1_i2.p2  ORF type:complete len:134 (+),score=30.96 TRINITY_DN1797_c0_g1_i2:225-626(+)